MIRRVVRYPFGSKDFNSILLFVLIILALSLLLFACSLSGSNNITDEVSTKSLEISDGGFLSGEVCEPPCFFGVIPGVTTKSDAIKILQSKGLYQACEEFDNSKKGGIHAIGCNYIIVFLQNNTDTVSGIGFQPSQQITVDKVIEKYGKPSAVSVAVTDPSNKGHFTAGMILYYDSINVSLGLAEQESGTYEVSPTTLIVTIQYFGNDEYQIRRRYIQNWNGYGTYEQWNP